MNTASKSAMLTITIASALWGAAHSASAAVIIVPADAPTIQAAVDLARNGDEILLADGTYSGSGNQEVYLRGKAITVRSASGNPGACILAPTGIDKPAFYFIDNETSVTRLEDLTIQGNRVEIGRSPSYTPRPAHPTIRNCTFTGQYGGLSIWFGSRPKIVECTFVNITDKSPVSIYSLSDADLINCRFLGNVGGNAAGVYVDEANATLQNCEFIGNYSQSFAGALWVRFGSTVNLLNCSIVENIGGAGVIWLGAGSGSANYGTNVLNISNCNIWGNRNYVGDTPDEGSQIRKGPNINEVNVLNINYSTLDGWTGGFGGTANNGTDPAFVDANGADDTYGTIDDNLRLSASSPAIDSGDNSIGACALLDLDGQARFEDDAGTTDTGNGSAPIIDRGAYEYGLAAAVITDCNDNLCEDSCDIADGSDVDCNTNGIPDSCDIGGGFSTDCNLNNIPDACDLAVGTSYDCNTNGILDECDIASGHSQDCNENEVPDECDIATGSSNDVNTNGVPDECDPDCNANLTPDDYDLSTGDSEDCNTNGIPDECDVLPVLEQITYETATLLPEWSASCDDCETEELDLPTAITLRGETYVAFVQSANGYVELLREGEEYQNYPHDENTFLLGAASDLSSDYFGSFGYDFQADRIVFYWLTETYNDEDYEYLNLFQVILTHAGTVQWNFIYANYDDLDEDSISGIYFGHSSKLLLTIAEGSIPTGETWYYGTPVGDCNTNGIPDECELASGASQDCNTNSVPDECDIAAGDEEDCNTNGVPDACEIGSGASQDCDTNGVPDECDIAAGDETDCNTNGIPDACEPGLTDCDTDGTLDVCEPDADGDGVPDDCDICPNGDDLADLDNDGVPNACDGCPNDAAKNEPGACGCGVADTDSDGDGVPDCFDECPNDALKIAAGACGCGKSDADDNGDGVPDCIDLPPAAQLRPVPEASATETHDVEPALQAAPCGMVSPLGLMVVSLSLLGAARRRRRGHA